MSDNPLPTILKISWPVAPLELSLTNEVKNQICFKPQSCHWICTEKTQDLRARRNHKCHLAQPPGNTGIYCLLGAWPSSQSLAWTYAVISHTAVSCLKGTVSLPSQTHSMKRDCPFSSKRLARLSQANQSSDVHLFQSSMITQTLVTSPFYIASNLIKSPTLLMLELYTLLWNFSFVTG